MTPISSAGKVWDKRTSSASSADGFTLLELIVVLILVSMLAGLATPIVMSVLDRMQRNSALNQMASFLRSTRTQAVSTKTPIVFHGDLNDNSYWWINSETEETSPLQSLTGKIRFAGFDDGKDSVERGVFSITFYPMGSTTGGVIFLNTFEDGKEEAGYQLSIDPITGRPKVHHES